MKPKINVIPEGNSIAQMRAQYAKIRARSHEQNKAAFNGLVSDWLIVKGIADPTPADYVRAALNVRVSCKRCAGTGAFVTRVENGVPTGPGGICYRCVGRGYQTDADARRNYGADMHMIVRACGG